MKEKEKIIIDSAIKFFAQKGFSSTSVQEIASDCGISKGAFYLYFKSKDSLLYKILQYYYDELIETLEEISQRPVPSRDKYIDQLTFMFDHALKHKEFIIMQSKEQAIPLNNSIKELLAKMQAELQDYNLKGLLAIYGEEKKKYLLDLLIIQDGLIHSFLKVSILDSINVSSKDIASYLLKRLDSIITDMVKENEHPLFSNVFLKYIIKKPAINFMEDNHQHIVDAINSIQKKMEHIANKEEIEVTLEVLMTEIHAEEPRVPIIKGMLYNLNGYDDFQTEQKKIADYYQIEL
ncbi:TetR/AcrR family transcriptional regulator [Cytobacillus oceanisediminis]|uniref:TetR/AcrR family transcriptional regulator n=2 Tax=Niallia TaxID=2837506 RepID=A0A941GEH6_NIACI|nr:MULTISPECIES: TetR/AcrR family transcriptional regulator [Bacillaceae]MBQ6446845.1 TetR/AcrR family transcriptional regulator [Bacillus sp. (in: firmicutes)]MDU1846095.1 TetR/AcrR family transcriptional regulator [Niallia nealsonii]MBZ9534003.1 TetR/AcrR family transcriptional regulator [Cytobacillus oceanisediminis]MCB5235953.1 TetR/AcrR family transcriptional regulator [Niallia circulans]NMO78924.1 TetR/AcrR family transcriptional regulator [Niallia alba]